MPLGRQRPGFLVYQQNIVTHPVANFKILPDYACNGSTTGSRPGHRFANAPGHFRMYGFAHHVQDIFFRSEIFVQGTDGRTGCPGNLPGGGFMETLLDEKLNGSIGDLAAAERIGISYVVEMVGGRRDEELVNVATATAGAGLVSNEATAMIRLTEDLFRSTGTIIGRVLEAAGVVLIDRKNTASAIEAMTPLVDAMRVEGKSVALSPEGTRSISPRLAAFKKGAFHLAMQAGVPVVPIVIHNSGDVQPKGDMLYHPGTVEVEVLPPIDTSDWSTDTLDKHIADVRNMYLRALEQDEKSRARPSDPVVLTDVSARGARE